MHGLSDENYNPRAIFDTHIEIKTEACFLKKQIEEVAPDMTRLCCNESLKITLTNKIEQYRYKDSAHVRVEKPAMLVE